MIFLSKYRQLWWNNWNADDADNADLHGFHVYFTEIVI